MRRGCTYPGIQGRLPWCICPVYRKKATLVYTHPMYTPYVHPWYIHPVHFRVYHGAHCRWCTPGYTVTRMLAAVRGSPGLNPVINNG